MKRRRAFRSVPFLWSAAILLSLWLMRVAGEQTQVDYPLAPLARGSLEIWVPKTFFTGRMDDPTARVIHQYQWSPLLSEFERDFPVFDLRFNILDRAEFVQAVHLAGPNPPPDILFVDNQSERGPLMDSDTVMQMLGPSRFNLNGWWLIFRQSKNLEAAQAFLLWLSRSPHWQPWRVNAAPMEQVDVTAVQAISTEAVKDYLRADA
ncbi:MAG: hypothetical protein M3Y24_05985 [Acidobacteriota bacterium]|nr:hypothetical protein [Acidobacteriota bacterium]